MNLIVSLAAALSILAAVIHVFVAPHHWEHWWGYGALFVLVGVAQALFGFALLWWPKRFPPFPRRVILVLGIVANLAIIAFYVLTRTVGIPFGPEAGTVEDVGAVDLVSKVVETLLVAVLAALWVARRRIRRAEQP